MRILVLCERIQATQLIAFGFNQSLLPYDKRIDFQICSGQISNDLIIRGGVTYFLIAIS